MNTPPRAPAPAADESALDAGTLSALRSRLDTQADELGAQIDAQRALLSQPLSQEGDSTAGSSETAALAEEEDEALSMIRHAQAELRAVHEALSRMAAGTYGWCAECGEPIGQARLIAVPEARTCLGCQTEAERAAGHMASAAER